MTMPKVRIDFPDDLAKEMVDGYKKKKKMVWECEDINLPKEFKKVKDDVIIETEHTKVTLHKEELKKILSLLK